MEILKKDGTKKQLSIHIKKADTFVSRLRGLMFRKHLPEDEGLWITPCNSIHMFFMNFPIDVIFLSKENVIVKTVENLQPRKVVPTVKNAFSTLEIASGLIDKYNIQVGDQISF